jgi:hypothetical protein
MPDRQMTVGVENLVLVHDMGSCYELLVELVLFGVIEPTSASVLQRIFWAE